MICYNICGLYLIAIINFSIMCCLIIWMSLLFPSLFYFCCLWYHIWERERERFLILFQPAIWISMIQSMASQFPAASCYSEHVGTNSDVLPLLYSFSGWLFPTNLLESVLTFMSVVIYFKCKDGEMVVFEIKK